LIKAAATFGIKVGEPGFIAVGSLNAQNWIDELEKDIKKNGIP
jgi:hypothetical protein